MDYFKEIFLHFKQVTSKLIIKVISQSNEININVIKHPTTVMTMTYTA